MIISWMSDIGCIYSWPLGELAKWTVGSFTHSSFLYNNNELAEKEIRKKSHSEQPRNE